MTTSPTGSATSKWFQVTKEIPTIEAKPLESGCRSIAEWIHDYFRTAELLVEAALICARMDLPSEAKMLQGEAKQWKENAISLID